MKKDLTTAEKLIIIAHHPDKGHFMVSAQYLGYGIAGAVLTDLASAGLITMTGKLITTGSGVSRNDRLTDEVWAMIAGSPKARKAEYWISRIANRYNRYLKYILHDLEKRRMLTVEEKRFLGLIPWRKSYLVETSTRDNLLRQLKSDILSYRHDAGSSLPLAGLIEACHMHRQLTTDREELKLIRSQLKAILKESPLPDAVHQTIRRVQAALIASTIAIAVAARR